MTAQVVHFVHAINRDACSLPKTSRSITTSSREYIFGITGSTVISVTEFRQYTITVLNDTQWIKCMRNIATW